MSAQAPAQRSAPTPEPTTQVQQRLDAQQQQQEDASTSAAPMHPHQAGHPHHAAQPIWQGQPQPGYAYPAPQPARPTSGLAIATFVLGLLGFAILPVILGHIALGIIRRTGQSGTAFAIVGLVLGYLAIAGWVLVAALVGAGLVVFGG